MTVDVFESYNNWLNRLPPEDPMRSELMGLSENEIIDSFYTSLSFGTAGLRGKMGPGTNRMNRYTLGQAAQGYADYLNRKQLSPVAAVSYDSRNNSRMFAELTASVFAANGIKCFLYPVLTPTPLLSFAIRFLNCSGGVMITASHNSKEYNGFKVYGPDGCQIDDDEAGVIMACIKETDLFTGVNVTGFTAALKEKMIEFIPHDVNEAFYEQVLASISEPDAVREAGLKVLYTPLNGTGLLPVTTVLRRMGLQDLTVVKEQEHPDGDFSTCPKPNPELREAFDVSMAHAAALKPDLILVTDPDADRVACAVLHAGEYYFPTGNEMGVLLTDYVLSRRSAHGTLPADPVIVRSIVSTRMTDMIAQTYGCTTESVLTGFKNIAGIIRKFEARGEEDRFVMGFEESIGYMFGTFVRDKDAVTASAVICEMTSWHKLHGRTLKDVLLSLYEQYGFYMDRTKNYIYEGVQGVETMKAIMASLRSAPPAAVAGKKVLSMTDLQSGVRTDLVTGESFSSGLPEGNVLIFELEDRCSIIVRPSGTEPKLKLYCGAAGPGESITAEILSRMCRDMDVYCKK
jgi:phosphoglucomutase